MFLKRVIGQLATSLLLALVAAIRVFLSVSFGIRPALLVFVFLHFFLPFVFVFSVFLHLVVLAVVFIPILEELNKDLSAQDFEFQLQLLCSSITFHKLTSESSPGSPSSPEASSSSDDSDQQPQK